MSPKVIVWQPGCW